MMSDDDDSIKANKVMMMTIKANRVMMTMKANG